MRVQHGRRMTQPNGVRRPTATPWIGRQSIRRYTMRRSPAGRSSSPVVTTAWRTHMKARTASLRHWRSPFRPSSPDQRRWAVLLASPQLGPQRVGWRSAVCTTGRPGTSAHSSGADPQGALSKEVPSSSISAANTEVATVLQPSALPT